MIRPATVMPVNGSSFTFFHFRGLAPVLFYRNGYTGFGMNAPQYLLTAGSTRHEMTTGTRFRKSNSRCI